MVTASTLDVATFTKDNVTWIHNDVSEPGGCDVVDWCCGDCDIVRPQDLGETHGREIARAVTPDDEVLLAVDVGQWVADPRKPIRDGGTVFWPNQDKEAYVLLCTFSEHHRGAKLQPANALTLGYALRLAGHMPFADAMYSAFRLAKDLNDAREQKYRRDS